jgi:GntR family transcriptional regulator/MocR family aminotransferase
MLEKYIYSVKGSGYFVCDVKTKKNKFKFNTCSNKGIYPKISKRAKSFNKHVQIKKKVGNTIAFRPGLPPLDMFPVGVWKNISNKYWKTVSGSQLSYSNSTGLNCLKQNISDYLRVYRNIICRPDQLIITTGSLHSLSLIANSLINKNDEIVLENAIYPQAYSLFKSLKAEIISANIDKHGIKIKEINCKKPKLVYTTPSNQYPTGVKMSLKRRLEVIKWASSNNSLIIEDDYDHEFSNWENPVSSIFGLDNEDRTVYLGTFNKLLHPSIRIGYMVVPEFLKHSIKVLYESSSRFVSPSTQTILSYFIDNDYLNKHLRNIINVSKERKSFFLEEFKDKFENEIRVQPSNGGLHLIAEMDTTINDVEISNHFRTKGIIAYPYSNYFINKNNKNGLVMGYGSVNNKIIKETIQKMHYEYRKILR